MKRTTAPTLLLAAALMSCGEAAPEPVSLSVREIDSPAVVDSGEPFLSVSGDLVLMSWLARSGRGVRQLLFAHYDADAGWTDSRPVIESDRLLVNVADFPSVVRGPGGDLWAHWLERDGEGLGYGVRVAHSLDDGATWSDSWTPHEDGTATEHGFVSAIPVAGGVGWAWLDGRAFAADGPGGWAPSPETALFFRIAGASGWTGPETPVDLRVCDCCQTDAAPTSQGAVLVYRDRSPEEIRDIRVARYEGGSWTDGGMVHDDGWETGACPINGPAVAARDGDVVVAWFTAAGGESRVNVAFSRDAARSFAPPVRVDEGSPAGRVDVVLLDDGTALVSWVERMGGDRAEVRVRRVGSGGRLLETASATSAYTDRVVGFPRLAYVSGEAIIVAWTDGAELTPRVRVTRIDVDTGRGAS